MPGKVPLPKRIPLAFAPENRDTTTSKDARLVNCYLEQISESEYHVVKRPGINATAYFTGISGTIGGCYTWNGVLITIDAGRLYYGNTNVGAVDTTGGRYWFSAILGAVPKLVLSNTTHMYTYDLGAGLVAAGAVSAYPNPMVPGLAYLDGTLYTMTSGAFIFGSKINDVTNWDPINVILANIEPDNGVALAKQLNYVIAFKQWTTEVFYDAGNAAGSPLQANQAAKMSFGCVSAYSVLDIDGDLFWLSATRSGSTQALMMHNLVPTVISNAYIERLIQNSDFSTVYAWCYKGDGHTFYVVTLKDLNLTLAYDIRERTWCQWTDWNGNYVPIISSTFHGINVLVQHETNGNVYIMQGTTYTDLGVPFAVDIYTPNFDAGVDRRKMITRIRFNGDQTPGLVLQVRCNDYDYSPTKWTNYRTVDMNRQRPYLDNCGTFYRRAYNIHNRGPGQFRLRSLDVDMDLGEL
jgi:hypothetical protein